MYFSHADKEEEQKRLSKHIANKKETCLIECVNSRIRHYLARFNRRTKCYSKSIDMIYYSLCLLFDKLYWHFIFNDDVDNKLNNKICNTSINKKNLMVKLCVA